MNAALDRRLQSISDIQFFFVFWDWQELSIASAVDISGEFLQPSADGAAASETNSSQRLVIWGTDVNVGTCKEKFQVWNLGCQSFTAEPFPQHEWLCFDCCTLWASSLSEVPAEVHWPQFQRRRERWSGSEWAVVHAETGGGAETAHLSAPLTGVNQASYLMAIFIFYFFLQISVVGDPVLNVNCLHVQSFDAELYRQLISYPQVMSCSPSISISCNSCFLCCHRHPTKFCKNTALLNILFW